MSIDNFSPWVALRLFFKPPLSFLPWTKADLWGDRREVRVVLTWWRNVRGNIRTEESLMSMYGRGRRP